MNKEIKKEQPKIIISITGVLSLIMKFFLIVVLAYLISSSANEHKKEVGEYSKYVSITLKKETFLPTEKKVVAEFEYEFPNQRLLTKDENFVYKIGEHRGNFIVQLIDSPTFLNSFPIHFQDIDDIYLPSTKSKGTFTVESTELKKYKNFIENLQDPSMWEYEIYKAKKKELKEQEIEEYGKEIKKVD